MSASLFRPSHYAPLIPPPDPGTSPTPRTSVPHSPPPSPSWALPEVCPPGPDAPPTCEVPHFAPLRVRGTRHGLRRLVRARRRAAAAGLAVTAAALLTAGPSEAGAGHEAERTRGHPSDPPRGKRQQTVELVTAPVRIADGATVRLLRPGDRVDVIAAGEPARGATEDARVVARGARVTRVPDASAAESGALVLLSVPRATAARLAGASTTSRLAVTVC